MQHTEKSPEYREYYSSLPCGIRDPSHGTLAAAVDRGCDRLSIDFCPVRASHSQFPYQSLRVAHLQDPAVPLEVSRLRGSTSLGK